jgi:hypothetical protein
MSAAWLIGQRSGTPIVAVDVLVESTVDYTGHEIGREGKK